LEGRHTLEHEGEGKNRTYEKQQLLSSEPLPEEERAQKNTEREGAIHHAVAGLTGELGKPDEGEGGIQCNVLRGEQLPGKIIKDYDAAKTGQRGPEPNCEFIDTEDIVRESRQPDEEGRFFKKRLIIVVKGEPAVAFHCHFPGRFPVECFVPGIEAPVPDAVKKEKGGESKERHLWKTIVFS
jgi:hypothetical protein